MPTRDQISGVILAGGQGRRLGGIDKGLMPVAGRRSVEQIIERFKPQVSQLMINANRSLPDYQRLGLPVITDALQGHLGPLAGLYSAMRVSSTAWVACVPCDSPFVPRDLVPRLAEAVVQTGAPAAIAEAAGRRQPVFALVSTVLTHELEHFLRNQGRGAQRWFASIGATVVRWDDPRGFTNINTHEELQRAGAVR